MTIKSALCVEQLSYQCGARSILNNLAFAVQTGEVFGIIGPNGAGKTSLLHSLAGLNKVQGRILWQGQALTALSPRQRATQLAIVLQQSAPIFALTVTEVVKMGLLPHRSLLSRTSRKAQVWVDEALNLVGLADKAQHYVDRLSGGEQQRCLIARALVQQAPLLLLDEPVSHLDVFYQHQLLTLLRQLAREQQKTVVVSLHDLNLAAAYCDRVAILEQGECLAVGKPEKVFTQSLLEQVFQWPCHVEHQMSHGGLQIHFHPTIDADPQLSGSSA